MSGSLCFNPILAPLPESVRFLVTYTRRVYTLTQGEEERGMKRVYIVGKWHTYVV